MRKLPRRRLDVELVEQGFFATKEDAMRAVLAGEVSTSDRKLIFPGEQVRSGINLHVRTDTPYVSRGGLKLKGALDTFHVDPNECLCLDIGCSTGGFTDCLLRRGARCVYSVDVGYAQFDWSLRNDARVRLFERTNIRDLPGKIDCVFDLIVCDISFTSVCSILPTVLALLAPNGRFLTLVKPQFEVEAKDLDSGGVVRCESVRRACLERVKNSCEKQGLEIQGSCISPLKGHKGNVEYFLLGRLLSFCDGTNG